MSDKEKSREKLVDSIRKSRAVDQETGQEAGASRSSRSTGSADKELARTKKRSRTSASFGSKETTSLRAIEQDPYQSGKRIWPD